MKQIILVLSVILVVMVSCKKEEAVKPTVTNNQANNNYSKVEPGGQVYKILKKVPNWGGTWSYQCTRVPGNCLSVVVIVGHWDAENAQNSINSLDNSISKGTVDDFFTNGNWSVLFPNLSADNLSMLQNNEVFLVKHDNGVGENPRYIYLAYYTDGTEGIVFALQIPNL